MIQSQESFPLPWLDASGFSCAQRCPARYMFERLMGLRPVTSDEQEVSKRDLAADFGTAMHAAIPWAYADGEAAIDRAWFAFNQVWQTMPYGPGDDKRNPLRAAAMLQDFHACRTGSKCPYTRMSRGGTAQTAPLDCTLISDSEIPFLLDWGIGIPVAGRIDAPVRLNSSGLVLALDYKTTQEISARYFGNFSGAPQPIIYTWALGQLLGGEPVFGFAVEALRVSAKNTETQLHIVSVRPNEVEELRSQASELVSWLRGWNSTRSWPQHFASCAPYASYGQPGYVCEFKPLCQLERWEDGLAMYKREEPFSPFRGA